MKKLLLLIILLGFSILGFSQEDKIDKKVSNTNASSSKTPSFQGIIYGVRGGYNISNLDFDGMPIMENKHRNSIYFGTYADISLSNIVSLVPELQFSAEGAYDENLHLDYIQLPIFLKFKLSKRIRFGIAPQVGWKVYKLNDGIKDIALSGVTGFEYKINEGLFIDARYTYGIVNIFHQDFGIEAKNTNVQIGVGYQF